MNKLKENFSKMENLFFYILLGTFVFNILALLIIYILQGEGLVWLLVIVLPIAIYYIVIFFVYIYRLVIYFQSSNKEEVSIWKSVVGLLLSPIGLLFSFMNYMIIVLSNIW